VPSRSSGEHQVSTALSNTAAGPASNSPQKKEKEKKEKTKVGCFPWCLIFDFLISDFRFFDLEGDLAFRWWCSRPKVLGAMGAI